MQFQSTIDMEHNDKLNFGRSVVLEMAEFKVALGRVVRGFARP